MNTGLKDNKTAGSKYGLNTRPKLDKTTGLKYDITAEPKYDVSLRNKVALMDGRCPWSSFLVYLILI